MRSVLGKIGYSSWMVLWNSFFVLSYLVISFSFPSYESEGLEVFDVRSLWISFWFIQYATICQFSSLFFGWWLSKSPICIIHRFRIGSGHLVLAGLEDRHWACSRYFYCYNFNIVFTPECCRDKQFRLFALIGNSSQFCKTISQGAKRSTVLKFWVRCISNLLYFTVEDFKILVLF